MYLFVKRFLKIIFRNFDLISNIQKFLQKRKNIGIFFYVFSFCKFFLFSN